MARADSEAVRAPGRTEPLPGAQMPFNAARTAMMLLSLASVAFVATATQPHLGAAPAPLVISVVDHGADPTGKEDATAAFRAALAAAKGSSSQGATPVVVPSGSYLITGTLNVTMQTLMGAAPAAWVADGSPQPFITFQPFGESPDGAAFVAVGAGGTVHGLHVQYDWAGHAIRPVPPCVDLRVGDGPRVTEMRISSAWDAVSSLGNPNCGRYYVADIFIVDAHHHGVAMGASFDFSTLDNIEVWNPNSLWAFNNGTGVLINGVDGVRASNIAVFRASVGLMVTDKVEGMAKHSAWVTFSNILTDYCIQGMVINGSNTVSLSSGSFQSHETSLSVIGSGGTVRVAASRFKSNGNNAVHINASSIVTISGSGMHRVFPSIKQVPTLKIEPVPPSAQCNSAAGSDGGCQSQTILVTGCDIESSDATVVSCAGKQLSDNSAAPILCADETVMLSANFLRPYRNDSLSVGSDARRDWGKGYMYRQP